MAQLSELGNLTPELAMAGLGEARGSHGGRRGRRLGSTGGTTSCGQFVLLGASVMPPWLPQCSYLVLCSRAGQDLFQVCEVGLEAGQLVSQLADDTCGLAEGLGGRCRVG